MASRRTGEGGGLVPVSRSVPAVTESTEMRERAEGAAMVRCTRPRAVSLLCAAAVLAGCVAPSGDPQVIPRDAGTGYVRTEDGFILVVSPCSDVLVSRVELFRSTWGDGTSDTWPVLNVVFPEPVSGQRLQLNLSGLADLPSSDTIEVVDPEFLERLNTDPDFVTTDVVTGSPIAGLRVWDENGDQLGWRNDASLVYRFGLAVGEGRFGGTARFDPKRAECSDGRPAWLPPLGRL
jgi:hypothetical protein